MAYSSREEISALTHALIHGVEGDLRDNGVTPGRRPMLVLDMDGNIAIGHNLKSGVQLALSMGDDAQKQSLPSQLSATELVAQGKAEEAIFSLKPLDTRLPQKLVDAINLADVQKRPYDIVLLTSRSTEDTLKVLRFSGVKHPEAMTIVADSGAILRMGGKKHEVRPLSPDEQDFLTEIESPVFLQPLESGIDAILEKSGLKVTDRPQLFIERKGIASNIHYNRILNHYGLVEDSPLGEAVGDFIRSVVTSHIEAKATKDVSGNAVFMPLEGPATVEVKIVGVDKGKGLEAVVKAVLAKGYQPSSVVFAGDDICKLSAEGHVSHGTDYAAFKAAPTLKEKLGIPFRTLHTQHPESGKLDDTDPQPSAARAAIHAGIRPDLIMPTPRQTGEWVAGLVEQALHREAEICQSAERRTTPPSASNAFYR